MLPTAEALFQNPALAQHLAYGILVVGQRGEVLAFNSRASEIFGREPVLQSDRYFVTYQRFLVDEVERGPHETPVAQALLRGVITENLEVNFGRPDGSQLSCFVNAYPVRNGDGTVRGAVAYFRPTAEAREVFAREGSATEDLPTLISYLGNDFRYRFANGAYQQWFGLSEKDIVGRQVREVFNEETHTALLPELTRALQGESLEVERYLPNARSGPRFLLVRYVPDKGPAGIVRGTAVIGTDITHRRQREMEEQAERKKQEAAWAAADLGTWVWDPTNDHLQWSASLRKIHGVSAEEPGTLRQAIANFVVPEDRPGLYEAFQAAARTSERFRLTFRAYRGDKGIRYLDVRGFGCGLGRNGQPGGTVIGSTQDITEQSAGEIRARESAARLQALTDHIPSIVWTFDGNTISYNHRWFDYTGLKEDGPAPDPITLVHPEDRRHVQEAWAQCLEKDVEFQARYRLLRHDGVYRWHIGRLVPGPREEGQATSTWYGTATELDEP